MSTNLKGDIALTQAIADLTLKECDIFLPVNDHPKADLVFLLNDKSYKCQVKHSKNGLVLNKSVGRSGEVKYKKSEIDVFAVYLPSVHKVVYVPFELGGIVIRCEETSVNRPCWWYEDFLDLDFEKEKVKSLHYSGVDSEEQKRYKETSRENWPEKSTLEALIWSLPSSKIAEHWGVSDRMVGKWCDFYSIEKPPRGYWSKKRNNAGVV